jgi:hypothetical protein
MLRSTTDHVVQLDKGALCSGSDPKPCPATITFSTWTNSWVKCVVSDQIYFVVGLIFLALKRLALLSNEQIKKKIG